LRRPKGWRPACGGRSDSWLPPQVIVAIRYHSVWSIGAAGASVAPASPGVDQPRRPGRPGRRKIRRPGRPPTTGHGPAARLHRFGPGLGRVRPSASSSGPLSSATAWPVHRAAGRSRFSAPCRLNRQSHPDGPPCRGQRAALVAQTGGRSHPGGSSAWTSTTRLERACQGAARRFHHRSASSDCGSDHKPRTILGTPAAFPGGATHIVKVPRLRRHGQIDGDCRPL